jgi:hypothetical protein
LPKLAYWVNVQHGQEYAPLQAIHRQTTVEADQVRTTRSAREGAAALGFDFDEMRAVVIALTTKDYLKA